MIVTKDRIPLDPDVCNFSLGEVLSNGARECVFVSHNGKGQFFVRWLDSKHNILDIVSQTGLLSTGEFEYGSFLPGVELSSVRTRGGLRTGPRKKIRNPADIALERKRRKRKQVTGGKPGEAAEPEMVTVHKPMKHGKEETEDGVSCLGCGKRIIPDFNSIEPYRCKVCKDVDSRGIPVFHSPILHACAKNGVSDFDPKVETIDPKIKKPEVRKVDLEIKKPKVYKVDLGLEHPEVGKVNPVID